MKRAQILSIFTFAALVAIGATGCKSPDKGLTPIGGKARTPGGTGPGQMVDSGKSTKIDDGAEGKPLPGTGSPDDIMGMKPDREIFQKDTVYFDYDRAAVRTSERSKVENVAGYLKSNGSFKLQIEGHCDERGTAEYNRALGERRALALREYLVRLGVDAERVFTISYGKDRPAVPGTDDASRAKNRRGIFVLLKPKE